MKALNKLIQIKLKLPNDAVVYRRNCPEWDSSSVDFSGEIRKTLRIIKPDAVYHFKKQPFILFFDFTQKRAKQDFGWSELMRCRKQASDRSGANRTESSHPLVLTGLPIPAATSRRAREGIRLTEMAIIGYLPPGTSRFEIPRPARPSDAESPLRRSEQAERRHDGHYDTDAQAVGEMGQHAGEDGAGVGRAAAILHMLYPAPPTRQELFSAVPVIRWKTNRNDRKDV